MKQLSIQAIKQKYDHKQLTDQDISQLKNDSRKGVQQIIKRYEREMERKKEEIDLYKQMSFIERHLQQEGFQFIAGIDEAGRGPLAGPVTAAAVVLDLNDPIYGLNDSKELSKEKRQSLEEEIQQKALGYSVQFVASKEIDRMNILQATKRAMIQTVEQLSLDIDYLLIDAVELPDLSIKQRQIIEGDKQSVSIAAASILAKEGRDRYMDEIHEQYPDYEFNRNKGYGTQKHMEALRLYGPCPEHRFSFSPVAKYMK